MRPRSILCLWLTLALAGAGTQAFAADDTPVDLELVLAVDVSWSMDYDEQVFQRAGYVAAFRDPEVIEAIRSGGWGRIAVTYVEWAGSSLQEVIVPWTLIEDAASAHAFADKLDTTTTGRLRRTSISGALGFSFSAFDDSGYAGLRRVIDVSGDGPNNQGLPVTVERDRLVSEGVIINGLPILLKGSGGRGFMSIPNLDVYYEDCVIGGTGAFALPIRDVSEFSTAIRQKLLLEIADYPPEKTLVQDAQDAPRVDCMIGEKMWMRWRRMNDDY
ncbi:DUF1194 domain-containing protein [Afifella marina]|uniref:VWFA domain-containing protein n=2 Tax=Hyphomicrobiales TaxID=356 RepID=A0A1G5MHH5_AFIMA|nr:DUF1194 domain-containing protein [Afifella marina]MBK1623736.1 DUF1194 domain-containing protein [Afifella marina DSM 2698]MBK1627348.1 DUF1194 domain-containing protein [Afifella marina]MBK5918622.1 hypothetical protein [Afifella marina]RAI22903.1 hypothetical protein CH311_03570 [Afifella marina DSM 2698]SCZ24655.1 Protein of unknown function [Afifella marina DSM 2698]